MGFHCVKKYGFPGPFSSRLRSRHGTDRQTDGQTDDGHQRLMPPPFGGRGIISNRHIGTQVVSAAEVTFKRYSRSQAMSPFDTSHMNSWVAFRCNYVSPYLVQHCVLPFEPRFSFPWGRCSAKFCMDRKTLPCLQNASQHVPVYLQQFPSYSNHNCKKSPFYVPRPSFFVCPGDAPVAITQNVAWMKRQFSACQTRRSMYPSIFNSFPVIRTASAKNCRFHVPQPTFLFPLETALRLSRNMLHGWKDNACQTPRSTYLSIFNRMLQSMLTSKNRHFYHILSASLYVSKRGAYW